MIIDLEFWKIESGCHSNGVSKILIIKNRAYAVCESEDDNTYCCVRCGDNPTYNCQFRWLNGNGAWTSRPYEIKRLNSLRNAIRWLKKYA